LAVTLGAVAVAQMTEELEEHQQGLEAEEDLAAAVDLAGRIVAPSTP